jgi:hypothetical protein
MELSMAVFLFRKSSYISMHIPGNLQKMMTKMTF